MSEFYTIKKQTLTDIGDAIRSRIIDETRPGLVDYDTVTFSWDRSESTDISSQVQICTKTYGSSYADADCSKIASAKITAVDFSEEQFRVELYSAWNKKVASIIVGDPNQADYYYTEYTVNDLSGYFSIIISSVSFTKHHHGTLRVTLYDADGNIIKHSKIILNTITPSQMAAEIENMPPMIPSARMELSGACNYRFSHGGWDWFVQECGDRITTKDLTNIDYMFYQSNLTEIPFEFNFKSGGGSCNFAFGPSALETIPAIDFKQNSTYKSCSQMFKSSSQLREIGKLSNLYPSSIDEMFSGCERLRELPEFENLNLDRIYTYSSASCDDMFKNCHSLRSIPEDFLKRIYGCWTSIYSAFLNGSFQACKSLDEIRGINPTTGTMTSNMFNSGLNSATFGNCWRAKELIFALQDDGTPYTVNWKGQSIELQHYFGYTQNIGGITTTHMKNAGITDDKEVTDDASYQALKNDPDWWTKDVAYSRYNHDSAVNTINSLPDTSAYLATAGGTNKIIFKGESGSKTDGGAVNTLTEEEIAVATAKGWTVSFV